MSRPRKTRLQLMPLESRETPAVMNYNFATDKFNGTSGEVNLSITFINNDQISWGTSPPTVPAAVAFGTDNLLTTNLTISLTGTGVSTAGTPVGNSVVINLGGHSLTGDLKINLSSGPDMVQVFNGRVGGNVQITGGADDDQIILGGGNVPLQIGKNLKVNAGGGDDSIAFVGPQLIVGNNASIQMGAGNNAYGLGTPILIGNNFLVQAGNGTDPIGPVGAAGSSIGGNATFLPGPGQNSVALPAGLNIGGNLAYVGGAGTDSVFNDATVAGLLAVSLGAGIDNYTYGSSAFVGISANIKGGTPLGDVYTNFATITWPNTVVGFP
jgi:hypothetical protein